MKTFLIVGKNFSALSQKIAERGDKYVFLGYKEPPPISDAACLGAYRGAFQNQTDFIASLRTIDKPIDAVFTMYEEYIPAAAWAAEFLSLPGLPPKVAELSTDKLLMRQALTKSTLPVNPAFRQVTSRQILLDFASQYGYPLILKPTNLVKSLLVFKCSNEAELLQKYDELQAKIEAVYQKYAPHRQPGVIVEEFMAGSLHSVAALSDKNGTIHLLPGIADLQNGYEVGYDDNFLYSRSLPSKLTENQQASIYKAAEAGARALGIRNCPAHIEIIMTSSGPKIIEIGARIGGYRERMYQLASGIDFMNASLQVALGQPFNLTPIKNESCATIELFPKQAGTYAGINNEAKLRQLPSLNYLSIKNKPGDLIGKSSDGYKRAAIIGLHNADSKQFFEDYKFVNEQVYVLTA